MVAVSNLDVGSSTFTVNGETWYAIPFTTGSAPSRLSSVNLPFAAGYQNDADGFSLSLYSDASGTPAIPLEVLSGSSAPLPGDYSYTSGASTPLAANTTYWVVMGNSGTGAYSLTATDSGSETSVYGWSIGDSMLGSGDAGASWNNVSLDVTLSVSIAVPEPSAWEAIAGLGALGAAGAFRRCRRVPA